jgi:hypothetical protein
LQTVQTVAFLSYLFHELQQYGPFLVIVPLSTITAWQTQFAAWAPDINVITYIGTAPAREVIRKYEFGPSNKKLKMNVLLTTYELTLRDAKGLGDIKWQALAVDEVCWYMFLLLASILIEGPGASFEKLGESVVRGIEGLPCCLEATYHRHSSPEQREGYVLLSNRFDQAH